MGDLPIGSTVAGYRLDSLIARGGMGVVYRATHISLDRRVALKVIAGEYAEDDAFRERFLRESRLAARLDHPHVVPIYDAREEDGELIVAMRFVAGGDLKKRIEREGPLAPAEAVALLAQVGSALDAAHAAGIVHRDVKPHNILLEGDRAFLGDFGLAKALGESGAGGASVVGTVEYMSPEQWRGEGVGPAADVYSLGCVLYEALTGIAPFNRREGDAEPRMPQGLSGVIERAVDPDPSRRYASAGQLVEAARGRQGASQAPTRVLSAGDEGPHPGLSRWRRVFAGGFALWLGLPVLVGIVATLVIALFLVDGQPEVSDPIPIGAGPLRLAAGEGGVWVTSGADGTLTGIDPGSGEVVGKPLRVGRGVAGVAVGEGAVWVSSPRAGRVLRVDRREGVVARIPVGGRPGAIVVAGGRVWVADQGGDGVSVINPRAERPLKSGIQPHAFPLRLAYGAGGVWVSSASTGTIRRIDMGALLADAPIPAGRGPAGLTVAGGAIWVANSRSDSVTRIDPATRAPLGEPIEVGERPGGIAAGTDVVWVADAADDTVTRIDIRTGDKVGDPVEVGPDPGAVVVSEEAVWVANNGDGTVSRIVP